MQHYVNKLHSECSCVYQPVWSGIALWGRILRGMSLQLSLHWLFWPMLNSTNLNVSMFSFQISHLGKMCIILFSVSFVKQYCGYIQLVHCTWHAAEEANVLVLIIYKALLCSNNVQWFSTEALHRLNNWKSLVSIIECLFNRSIV